MDKHFEGEVRLLEKEAFKAIANVFFVFVGEAGDAYKGLGHGMLETSVMAVRFISIRRAR